MILFVWVGTCCCVTIWATNHTMARTHLHGGVDELSPIVFVGPWCCPVSKVKVKLEETQFKSQVKTNGGHICDYEGVDKASKVGFPLVAVGTSGTGAEMTRFACITDEDRKTKLIVIDNMMTPLLTVEDPALLQMPRHLTAATGMDCLAHGIEAYLSSSSNPVTDASALHSIKLASAFLKEAHATTKWASISEKKRNSRARDMMGYASYLAAMAFNNAGLGLAHAMAHQIGGLYNLPHGVCVALLLPTVFKFNAKACPIHTMDIAIAMGFQVCQGEGSASAHP